MYTNQMRRAFHSIIPPKGFNLELIDNEHFITVKLNEYVFANMVHDDKIQALQYVLNVKKALEMEGAIVLVTREAIK
jgi:hypothetical protein